LGKLMVGGGGRGGVRCDLQVKRDLSRKTVEASDLKGRCTL